MRIPVIQGSIDRRILVNFRVDPAVMAAVLPEPFRPQLVNGQAIAGVCLIRLKRLRPRALPLPIGIASENAAHRIAVEWSDARQTHTGVYIPRRDTDSRLSSWAGGRLFPGVHHQAYFDVHETEDRLRVALRSVDDQTHLSVDARPAASLPDSSVFDSLEEASAFFEAGSLGYSDTRTPGRYDGLELRCQNWRVSPLAVDAVSSSFFEDRRRFPPSTWALDHALLMRGIDHEWHSRNTLCC